MADVIRASLAMLCLTATCSPATAQTGKITDYRVASQRLYAAWRGRDRPAALRVASKEAVDKLWGVRWHPMRSRGCQRIDEGFQCVYQDPKLDLRVAFTVEGGVSAGYGVTTVSFSSEE